MKIVHCIFGLSCGGSESLLIDIVNKQSLNHSVSLIIINAGYDCELLKTINERVKIYFINRKIGSRSIQPIIKLNSRLLTLLPDVIHIHNEAIAKIILPFFRNLFLTVHCHGVPNKNFHRMKTIYAISDSVRDEITKNGNFSVVTIPNGIDLGKIRKRDLNPISGKMRIIQVARLEHTIKGQDILVKALALLVKKGYDITVDFIGTGSSIEYIRALSQELGISERVGLLGMLSRDYIYNHLCEYDLMCHPARTEGFGLVVAEGMAAYLPVLVPDRQGAFEVIDYGKYGFSFAYENEIDCAKEIESIYNNYEKVLEILPKAYKHVESNYSLNNMVEKYIYNYGK